MKIGLQTWGSDGDIRPFIALAGGLRKAGHEVTLIVASVDGKDYSDLAAALNFKIIHIDKPLGRMSFDEAARKLIKIHTLPGQMKFLMEEGLDPFQVGMFETAMEAARDCDLLVGHHIAGALKAAAEKTGRDYVSVFLCPIAIPSDYRPPDSLPNLGKFINRMGWKLAGIFADSFILNHFNRLREQNDISLLKNLLYTGWKSEKLNLVAVSPSLCPPLPDWDETLQVCGFFDVPIAAEEWRPPHDLREFLNRGEPPIYLTFGSMTQLYLEETTSLLLEAARLSGKRAIVQSHWDRVKKVIPESANIYRISKTPHHNIFPLCALVVHHGGAGTTHSACYSGVPSVVVQHLVDQQFWGGELNRSGIGGRVMNIRNITPQRLAAEIRAMYDSKKAREKAGNIGKSMRAENGVARAVQLIEGKFLKK